jgi:hypothetical protein
MSISVSHKKRGRPATGETPQIGVRLSGFLLAGVERFAEHENIGRSEAVRQLLEIGLAAAALDEDFEDSQLAQIDRWRNQDERSASRPNAVRLLVKHSLDHLHPSRSDV